MAKMWNNVADVCHSNCDKGLVANEKTRGRAVHKNLGVQALSDA